LEITVRGGHLFFDSLVSDSPSVVFDTLAAADIDGDGDLSRAELEAADIGNYDPGNDDTITNLWSWVEAQSQMVGHVDGEGHCDAHSHDHDHP